MVRSGELGSVSIVGFRIQFPEWTIALTRAVDSTETIDGRTTRSEGLTARAADTIAPPPTPLPEALFSVQEVLAERKTVLARKDPANRWTVRSTESAFLGTQFRVHAMGRAYRLIEYVVARSAAGPAAQVQIRVLQAAVSPLTPRLMTDEERRIHCGGR